MASIAMHYTTENKGEIGDIDGQLKVVQVDLEDTITDLGTQLLKEMRLTNLILNRMNGSELTVNDIPEA